MKPDSASAARFEDLVTEPTRALPCGSGSAAGPDCPLTWSELAAEALAFARAAAP
jgi:hypothetical protein